MIKKALNSSLVMTWLDILVKFGMNIFLLPIATVHLKSEELAYFLFIGALLGIAYLAEGGINRVILRATAYFKEGATTLPNNFEELHVIKSDGIIDYRLLGQLVQTSFIIYFILGVVSLIIFFTIGFYASENIISKQQNIVEAYAAFVILSIFAFLYIMQLRWVGLIQGLGYLAHQKKVELVFGLVRIVLTIIAILLGYGVLGVVVSMLLSVLVANVFYKKMFYFYLSKEFIQEHQYFSKDILRKLIPSAWKQSVLAWGSYLIYQGTIILAAQLDDVKLIASYLLTLQVVNILMRISNAPAYSYYPFISKAMAKSDTELFKDLLFRSLKISLGLYLIGAVVIFYFGNDILKMLNANALFLSKGLLALILFMYMLELHHVTHATIYTATNHIPFVLPSIISGMVIVFGGWFVIDKYGLWGIVLVQFLVQLSFNNWYPVWLNYRFLNR